MIMVPGQPSVLETAAHSGTTPGCGDCSWELILACVINPPAGHGDQNMCSDAGQAPALEALQVGVAVGVEGLTYLIPYFVAKPFAPGR